VTYPWGKPFRACLRDSLGRRSLLNRLVLPPGEKQVLGVIIDHARSGLACWPSLELILTSTGRNSPQTAITHKKSLRDKGLLSWKSPGSPGNPRTTNLYELHPQAMLRLLLSTPVFAPRWGRETSPPGALSLPGEGEPNREEADASPSGASPSDASADPSFSASSPSPFGERRPGVRSFPPENAVAEACEPPAAEAFEAPAFEAPEADFSEAPVTDAPAVPVVETPEAPVAEAPAAPVVDVRAAPLAPTATPVATSTAVQAAVAAEATPTVPSQATAAVGTFEVPVRLVLALWTQAYLAQFRRDYVADARLDHRAASSVALACSLAVARRLSLPGVSDSADDLARQFLSHVFSGYFKKLGAGGVLLDRGHPLHLLPADLNGLGVPWKPVSLHSTPRPTRPAPIAEFLSGTELAKRCQEWRKGKSPGG